MPELPKEFPIEITNKYEVLPNALRQVVKDDWRDRLEVEIGDEKESDIFYPQLKLKRWDNEVNFSVRLKDTDYEQAQVTTNRDKIIWSKGNIDIEYYDYTEGEGGYKMVWHLKSKPATNKVEFTIQSKGLDFFYQPSLHPSHPTWVKDKLGGMLTTPENMIGGYEVYHSSKGGMNDINGKEYKVGKAFQIYRPKIIDVNGVETWGILKIENGIYSVEIPQEFLDTAVYPIKSNDTFGYTTEGASTYNLANYLMGSVYSASGGGNITSMSVYSSGTSGNNFKLGAYKSADRSLTGYTLQGSHGGGLGWQTVNIDFGGSISATAYYLIWWTNTTAITWRLTTSGGTNNFDAETYGNPFPNPWAQTAHQSWRFSIYATYEAAAGGPAGVKTINDLAIASVKTINDLVIGSVKTINDAA